MAKVCYAMHAIDRDKASHHKNNKSKRARKFRIRTFGAKTFRTNMSWLKMIFDILIPTQNVPQVQVDHKLNFGKKITYDQPTLVEDEFELSSVESEAYLVRPNENQKKNDKNRQLTECPSKVTSERNLALNSVPGWLNTL